MHYTAHSCLPLPPSHRLSFMPSSVNFVSIWTWPRSCLASSLSTNIATRATGYNLATPFRNCYTSTVACGHQRSGGGEGEGRGGWEEGGERGVKGRGSGMVRVKGIGMRLLCSKIYPLCYARMLQTMSNYALGVSLLCSCSKLINE